MLEERIKELEGQLIVAQASIDTLTKTNATLVTTLAAAELSLKRTRRSARQDGNALRSEITNLQSRRG